MNPQDPNGAVPPQPTDPQQPQIVVPSVVQIPGQDPLVVAPQQPLAPQQQPEVDHTPYEFITNPQKPVKVPVLTGKLTGGSTLKRAAVFGGGLIVLVIIATIISSILKGGGPNTAPLLTVIQEQTELVRVSTAGATAATDPTTQAFAYSVQLSATSASVRLTTYMKNNFKAPNPKLLGLKASPTVDTELQNALTNNTYDSTLVKVLQSDLADYSQALKLAYAAKPGPNGQKLLSSQYDGAQLLIKQGNQVSSAASN